MVTALHFSNIFYFPYFDPWPVLISAGDWKFKPLASMASINILLTYLLYINMLIQDTFTSIIRFVFNIFISKYMHVI